VPTSGHLLVQTYFIYLGVIETVSDVVLQVSEVEARSALIQLTPPSINTAELDVEQSEFQYELSLSDKQDGTYTVMYRSAAQHFLFLLDISL